MQAILSFLVRLVLLAAGLVFAASLLVALACFAVFWALRYGWARLTGRPVTPFVMRVDPRAGFGRVFRPDAAQGGEAPRRELADVTDVQVKEPRS